MAAKNGQVEKFKLLLDYNEDKNPRRKIGYAFTPFDYAVRHRHLPICKIIVEVLSKKLSKDRLSMGNLSKTRCGRCSISWLSGLDRPKGNTHFGPGGGGGRTVFAPP